MVRYSSEMPGLLRDFERTVVNHTEGGPVVSLLYSYYNSPEVVRDHLHEWNSWPEHIYEQLEIVVVDDGSKQELQPILEGEGVASHVKLKAIRIEKDVPWNISGARNTAALYAEDEFIFILDMDIALTYKNAKKLAGMTFERGYWYRPSRRFPITQFKSYRDKHPRTFTKRVRKFFTAGPFTIKSHPACFILSREDYWAVGGYDEDFSGHYNNDANFKKNLSAVASPLDITNFFVTAWNHKNDAEVDNFGRLGTKYDASENPLLRAKMLAPPYKAINPIRLPHKMVFDNNNKSRLRKKP